MATLELVFNCLNLFVTDEENGTVHVLMPTSTGHGNKHRHVVRIFHAGLKGDQKKHGLSMEGWALILGGTPGTAETDLEPAVAPFLKEELVDLTRVTGGKTVDKALLADAPHPLVAARVTLRGGRLTQLKAEHEWEVDGQRYRMAHNVTWQIMGIPHELTWVDLAPPSDDPPIKSLKELPLGTDGAYHMSIHHVTPVSIPPGQGGGLDPADMAHHFSMFYPLVGVNKPDENLLPKLISFPNDGVNCAAAKAKGGGGGGT